MTISTTNGKRRTRGMGSVSKRRDGSWEGRLNKGWEGGKRRYLSVYGRTKLEAEDKLEEARRNLKRGKAPVHVATTVEHHLADWLTRAELRPSTLRRYQAICRHQLTPHLGRIRLVDLQPSDVERMMAALRSQPSPKTGKTQSPYTVTHVRSVLRTALSDAERNGLVDRNVAKLAKAPRLPKIEPAVLTPEAVALVLAACEPGLRRMVTVAIDTGLRQGEQLGLRWGDVDPDQRCLYVRATLERVGDAYRLGEPKSATSRRTVALSAVALQALREEHEAQLAAQEAAGPKWRSVIADLVFTTAVGAPRNGSSVTHGLQDALAAAGRLRLRWHDLRAIHVGLLVQAGVGQSVARDRLGHSSIAVTSRFYTGIVDALQREAADKVGRLLEG